MYFKKFYVSLDITVFRLDTNVPLPLSSPSLRDVFIELIQLPKYPYIYVVFIIYFVFKLISKIFRHQIGLKEREDVE